MSICYDSSESLLTLETASSVYQMKIDAYGYLEHLYYGRPAGGTDMSYLQRRYDRGFSGSPYAAGEDRTFSLDTMPQEYTSFGVGDFRTHSIGVINSDGSRCAELHYVSHEIREGKYSIPGLPAVYDNGGEAKTLVITLRDAVNGLVVRLYYGVFHDLDVITRAAEIVNEGTEEVILEKASSLCLDIPFGTWDLICFTGRHCMERQPERRPLSHSVQVISSERGMSSHQQNPFVIVCDRRADEEHGDCYGMMLAYSGNFKAEAGLDQFGSARIVMGISDTYFQWHLAPGESFCTPETILAYGEGLTRISHIFHRLIRHNICRGEYKLAHRPVLLNSWEASYFDFDENRILAIAKEAEELGIELFVLDDGWFRRRRDDNAGLGDWTADTEKFPGGLPALVEKINRMGMKFGIWVEPEMVNEDSDLYRAHPDWALKAPGRSPMLGRNQLVLDLGREEVRDYLYDAMAKLFRENNIQYVKWDMNRSLSDVYSAVCTPSRQGEAGHRYVLGIYGLLERLTEEFPHILFEGCAGGGGRFDAGMLYYTPQIWCSDDTDAVERIAIQNGTSFGYPVSAMGSHVSAVPNHQTGRSTPLALRGMVAMSGAFGYELDPGKLTEKEKQEIRAQIREFHRDQDLILDGLYYRLTDLAEQLPYAAWQFVSKDRGSSLLNLAVLHVQANAPLIHVRLKGLDPQAVYRIEEDGSCITGAALMYGGYTMPILTGDYPVFRLHLVRVCEMPKEKVQPEEEA